MTFVSTLASNAPLLLPDVVETGARIVSNEDDTPPAQTGLPRVRRRTAGTSSQPVVKQEAAMADQAVVTLTPAQQQDAVDTELAKLLEACATPTLRAEMLIKAQFYDTELQKQAPLLANLDEELSAQVVEEWFSTGDRLLKRAVWNARAGSEEIPLQKRAPDNVGETALAKLLDECVDPAARGRLLHKIGMTTTALDKILRAEGFTPERKEALVKQWLDVDPGEAPLRKNILDAAMGRDGKAIYGSGVEAGQVVANAGGAASTGTSSAIGGSETGSDQGIRRSIPRVPVGKLGTTDMPGQRGSRTATAPGGGKNDTGQGGVSPTLVRRTVTTGGLGSTQGSDNRGTPMKTQEDAKTNDGTGANPRGAGRTVKPAETAARRQAAKKGKDRWTSMDKQERGAELIKIAPDHLVESILAIPDEAEQGLVCEVAGEFAADLATWSANSDPNKLQKAELDAAIAEWLGEDPDALPLKKFVAEALGTAEEIPLALAKAIMAWQPKAAIRVRQAA